MYEKKIRRLNTYLPNSCAVQRLTVLVMMALNRKVIGDYKQVSQLLYLDTQKYNLSAIYI